MPSPHLLATNSYDCRIRANEFRTRASAAPTSTHRELFLYFARQWDLLAQENARIVDRVRHRPED